MKKHWKIFLPIIGFNFFDKRETEVPPFAFLTFILIQLFSILGIALFVGFFPYFLSSFYKRKKNFLIYSDII